MNISDPNIESLNKIKEINSKKIDIRLNTEAIEHQ
jgi:hypothetical protein